MKQIETIADYKKYLIDTINQLKQTNCQSFGYEFALNDVLSIIRDDDNVK